MAGAMTSPYAKRKPWQHSTQSRHDRGYGTTWDKLRLVILKRDRYLCQCPDCNGGRTRVTPANQVDHIIRKADGGSDDPSNLRSMNRRCHDKWDRIKKGERARPQVSVTGVPDGWVR